MAHTNGAYRSTSASQARWSPFRSRVTMVGTNMSSRRGGPLPLLMTVPPGRLGSDEDEWVAADDGYDLAALADQGGHALQRVAGQRAAGAAARDGDRHGLGALVAGAGAAEFPAVGGVEGLVKGLGGPALGDGGEVDRADGEGVGGAGVTQGAAGGRLKDQIEAAGCGGVGCGVAGRAAGVGGG